MKLPETVDVVVVGAGPTGLTVACCLRAAGVDVLVLDKVSEGSNTSRAAVIHARTLEVLEGLDVTRRLLADGLVVPVFTVRDQGRTLARLDFSDLPTDHPYTLMLAQSRTEAILSERLTELGGRVWRPFTVTDVDEVGGGVVVTAVDGDGSLQTVRATYVVGADGLHSVVRARARIGFTGGRYDPSFMLADIELEWPLSAREVQLFLAPDGLVVVAPLPGGRHRVVATVDEAPETPDAGFVQALLDHRGPGGATVRAVAWSSRFRVQHRVADRYRAGAVLLAGDAAHVHSPAGGQGMNTGIQDAVDLGSSLVDALAGRTPDAALDGYERRRRPVAQAVVQLTDRTTRLATVRGRLTRTLRNAIIATVSRIAPVRRRITFQIAELDADRARPHPGWSGQRGGPHSPGSSAGSGS